MTTQLDRIVPPLVLKIVRRFGVSATLYTARDGEATATGIKVTPAETKMVLRKGTAIYDEVSEVVVAATDSALSGFPVPPRPGDVLTYKSNTYSLIDGTTSIDSGESTAAYVLRFKGLT